MRHIYMYKSFHPIREISKVGEKRIYLFTSCGSHYSDDGLESIVTGLKQHDIRLIVV